MSCDECDQAEEEGSIAYFRWGKANVGFIGCPKHIKEIFNVLRGFQNGEDI